MKPNRHARARTSEMGLEAVNMATTRMSASRRPVDVAHAEQEENLHRKVRSGAPSFWLLPPREYARGILYPPGSLHPQTGDRTLLQELAPTQDDIWFKAMSLKQKTPCLAIGGDKLMPLIEFEDKSRLWSQVMRAETMGYWRQVLGHFGITADSIAASEMQLHAEADASRRV